MNVKRVIKINYPKPIVIGSAWIALAGLALLQNLGKLPILRPFISARFAQWVAVSGLFDDAYYSENTRGESIRDGLLHYVNCGDAENRSPHALFDPSHYRRQLPRACFRNVNAVLHYHLFGWLCGYSPTPWFDIRYYLTRNKDVARADIEPLKHFIRYGGQEGRSPSAAFDSGYYLRRYPEVARQRINPLLHYLNQGRAQGLTPRPAVRKQAQKLPGAQRPSLADWQAVKRSESLSVAPQLDVVIPIYRGADETLRCIYTVLNAPAGLPFELIIVNDASPDSDLIQALKPIVEQFNITWVENPQNLGFVVSINRGLAVHPERDAVILNSDTQVYGNWLTRLNQAAYAESNIGSVTPLSNNATICSYPLFCQDNPYPLELGYAELDQLAAKVNAGLRIDIPTGVGFCMYLRRDCLTAVGPFDEDAFGHGYGEENDFCLRASALGWKHVAACDTFVMHWGSVSFRADKAERIEHAMRQLNSRYPNYHRDIRAFIQNDPFLIARRQLDQARLHHLARTHNVLLITHNRGGGTERHILEETTRLAANGHGIFYLRPGSSSTSALISHPDVDLLPNLAEFSLETPSELLDQLRRLSISTIQLHHLVDFDERAPSWIAALVKQLDIPLIFDIHDYTTICPRINLIDKHSHYCGEPEPAQCNICLQKNGSSFNARDIQTWRDRYAELLGSAAEVHVPSSDAAQRLQRYFPQRDFQVIPHENGAHFLPPRAPQRRSEILRVAIVGAISKIKGYDVLLHCARDAAERQLPIEFVLFGYSLNDRALLQQGIKVTGRYLDSEAPQQLADLQADLVFLPSLWPETYSYTLSLALQCGLAVVAFEIGAIAERLRQWDPAEQAHRLVPLTHARDSRYLNQVLLDFSPPA